ncbi:MAG: di-heme oxidoredictase family protein [Kofleriaceae bacterium]|nr:di-heme oxidoredictase family protein [Kofleriaceae bacterium]
MRLGPLTLLVLAACGDNVDEIDERRQGGDTTVDDRTREAFSHFVPTLDEEQVFTHNLGRGPFNFEWVPPQLGPLFNHSGCLACHGGNGRGLSEIDRGPFGSQALVRVSMIDGTPDVPGGNVSVPGYGQQLQDHATSGVPEVFMELAWRETVVYYGDGTPQPMRSPLVTINQPNGDPMPTGMATSYRQAPAVFGLGLLEAISDDTLRALEDAEDADADGISGRANVVWDEVAKVPRIGRFGHKATVVDLYQQAAAAFVNDVGLTNLLFREPDGSRDVNDDQLVQTTFFISTIAVPTAGPRDAAARRGRTLFDDFQCAGCHIPTLVTGEHAIPQLANQTIHPYTDLLLHDVGDLLTDARTDFQATGLEWRTPPLWGLGLAQVVQSGATFLHDGRARTIAEAILWHGGEAEQAREAFRLADQDDREALLAFLQTL